jgi:hypothetical protein
VGGCEFIFGESGFLSVSTEKIVELASLEDGSSIHEIRGRMATLLDVYEDSGEFEGLAPFLYVYHSVTSTVADREVEEEFFDSPEALESLDGTFAGLYFDAVRTYVSSGEMRRPWKSYFEYCSRDGGRPVIKMLLGINAHINADLAHALYLEDYSEKRDYERINGILESQLPSSMKYLAKKGDTAGALGLLDRPLAHREFRSLIVNWRQLTWENYQKLEEDGFEAHKEELYDQTERVAQEIIELEKRFDYLNLYSTVKKANRLKVMI